MGDAADDAYRRAEQEQEDGDAYEQDDYNERLDELGVDPEMRVKGIGGFLDPRVSGVPYDEAVAALKCAMSKRITHD